MLASIRDRSGYETASLFARETGGSVWRLAARAGPTRPWHVVLDPALIDALAQRGDYPNVRSIPGVGLRLSGLGCGSVTVHPVPGGSVLVLDSAFPRDDDRTDDVDAASLAVLGGSTAVEHVQGTDPSDDELVLIARVADVMRRTLDVPGSTVSTIVTAIRDVLGAERVVLVSEEHDRVTRVHGGVDDPLGEEAPSTIEAILRVLPPTDPIPDEQAKKIGVALGISGNAYRAAFCRSDGGRELVLSAFSSPPRVTRECLGVMARMAGSTRIALDVRRDAIEAHLLPERSRWAHDIHDGITQVVTAAVIQLENMRHLIAADPEAAGAAIEESQAEIRNTLADLRAIMSDLSEEGSVHARKPLEDHIEDIVQRWRLPARISVDGPLQDVPRQVLAVALVVIREALTNAAKHSSAKNVNVRIGAHDDAVTLIVADNGRGFEPFALERAGGRLNFGIRMMRQRVADVGGTIQIRSTPGRGTKVVASIPISGRAKPDIVDPGTSR